MNRLNCTARILCIVIMLTLIIPLGGCFTTSSSRKTSTTDSTEALVPDPVIESVIATTSGNEDAYFAILDIKVKNEGAEGVFLVIASVTQDNKTQKEEMDVYLKQGKEHELKMTFPLVWKGGKWTSDVKTEIP